MRAPLYSGWWKMQAQFWVSALAVLGGANGAIWMLVQWRINRRKAPTDRAEAFSQIADRLTQAAERAAQREHEDNEKLRAEVRALREEVEELRPLRAEVLALRAHLAHMQRDVTATRSVVERQQFADEIRWLGAEAAEPDPKGNAE